MVVDEELEKYLSKIDMSRFDHKELAIRYKMMGEEEKAREEFKKSITEQICASKYGQMGEDDRNDLNRLAIHSGLQIETAIELDLSKANDDAARQLYEWAAENSTISADVVNSYIEQERFGYIAQAYLWRGYALMMLGKFEEARPILKEVVPYFNRHKESFGEILLVREYNLLKALIPLCEYKLNPDEKNRKKAVKGLNDYIKSIKIYRRLWGYLYYYHLKEHFPEVYDSGK